MLTLKLVWSKGFSPTCYEIEDVNSTGETEDFYIVQLRDFRQIDPPLSRDIFFSTPYKEQLIGLLNAGTKNLFYNREPNLNQGAYLTPAPVKLINILNKAYEEKFHLSLFTPSDKTQDPHLEIYTESEEKESNSTWEPSEKDFLEHIKIYITAKGYYFDDETIHNYHICLKTRPLVILAGLSGTGKSKLSQLYAEAIGYTTKNGCYLRLPVRPNWNDDRYLIGYLNSITDEYETEPSLDFIMNARNDSDNLYFLCLDEMNLAHVEYYFSQFLSAMEEDEPEDRKITLYSATTRDRLITRQKPIDVPPALAIPTNLLFSGTINVDETTQPLSDKVMDRANTIEFFDVDLDKIPDKQSLPTFRTVTASMWQTYKKLIPDKSYRSKIVAIANILKESDMGLGYRVVHDIELYLANSKDILSPEVAFDLQVKQRILPHIRGTKSIESSLQKLLDFVKEENLACSTERLQEMKFRLERDGYVNFWR